MTAVVAAALTEDRHVGQFYELAGPQLLTFAEAVGEIAEATGREIRYVPVSPDQYASALWIVVFLRSLRLRWSSSSLPSSMAATLDS